MTYLRRYNELPEALLSHLTKRDTLTTTQLRDHIAAWARAESRGRLLNIDDEYALTPIDLSVYRHASQSVSQSASTAGRAVMNPSSSCVA